MKSPFTVIIEAIVVGLVLLGLVSALTFLIPKDAKVPGWATIFISGVVFHILFEYTGLNKKYVDAYYK